MKLSVLAAVFAALLGLLNALPNSRKLWKSPGKQESLLDRPIIGILSQDPPSSLESVSPNSTSYIAASYVKFIESAGARVVPILINQPSEYYVNVFNSVNGILFPGGSASIKTSGYAHAGAALYDLAIEANLNGDYFPVWGTCLGYEMLTYLSAGKHDYRKRCNSYNRALNLQFTSDSESSRLFGSVPSEVKTSLSTENITSNFHHWCLTPENFTLSGLDNFYSTLSINQDDNDITFISSIEAKNFPIWGLQFHPEKNIFEWSENYSSIPHSVSAVKAGYYFAEFFVNQARRNTHRFASVDEEHRQLIYNYSPVFTGDVSSSFEQCYFF